MTSSTLTADIRQGHHVFQPNIVFYNDPLTVPDDKRLRNHLQETLDDLPNNLPPHDQAQLLDDLSFLLHSPLFMYAIGYRIRRNIVTSVEEPLTPISMRSDAAQSEAALKISSFDIRIQWDNESWVTQLLYDDKMILEGRQLFNNREVGFEQSFLWFCEEANFLACEYKAREYAFAVRMGRAASTPLPGEIKCMNLETTTAKVLFAQKPSLKLKIRFSDTANGRAGIWCL